MRNAPGGGSGGGGGWGGGGGGGGVPAPSKGGYPRTYYYIYPPFLTYALPHTHTLYTEATTTSISAVFAAAFASILMMFPSVGDEMAELSASICG
mgnify:CR=1 FL=1